MVISQNMKGLKAQPQMPQTWCFLPGLQVYFILTGSFMAFCMDTFLMQMPNAKGWEGLVIPSSKRKWTSWIFNCRREKNTFRQLQQVEYYKQGSNCAWATQVNHSRYFTQTHPILGKYTQYSKFLRVRSTNWTWMTFLLISPNSRRELMVLPWNHFRKHLKHWRKVVPLYLDKWPSLSYDIFIWSLCSQT